MDPLLKFIQRRVRQIKQAINGKMCFSTNRFQRAEIEKIKLPKQIAILLQTYLLFNLFMQPDLKGSKEKEDVFKQMFKSSIRASYFNHMADNKFTNKSKLQINEIDQQQEVDQNTFRIMNGFLKPDDSFAVYNKKGRFYIEEQPFFSCIVSRRRYDLQLINHKLRVSKSQSETVQFFNFDTEQIEVIKKGSYFILKVQRCKKEFYFQPIEENAKQNIIDDWVSLLNKVIGVTLGKQKHFAYLPIKNQDFYCQQHISNQQFQKSCNSLDILLFKSPHSAARVQRVFTDSQYDHVGVVLRNRKNQIFIYESTSDEGVGLTSWKHMIKFEWYQSTDKIAWRRLNMKLTNQDIETIEAFVAKTLGKQFAITLQKLFLFNSKLKRTEEEQQKKTYFCSQLVARLYKQLHLLDAERSSTRYYPVDFSQKSRMLLKREGAFLEPERIIAFNR